MIFEKNKIYKIGYTLNDKVYIGFIKINNENLLVDIITNNIIDEKNIVSFENENINPKLIKFYKNYYSELDISFLEVKNFSYDTRTLYFNDILRFFNISLDDILKNNSNVLPKMVDKWTKYVKRYSSEKELEIYVKQINLFTKPIELISFLSYELYITKIPFWHENAKELPNYLKSNFFPVELIDAFNTFNYNIIDMINNQNYKEILSEKYKQIYEEEYTNNKNIKLPEIIKKRIEEARKTLKTEEDYANENNDDEFLLEISIIREEIDNLELDIYKTISNLTYDEIFKSDTSIWWPELLYPVEKVPFSEEYKSSLIIKKHLNI